MKPKSAWVWVTSIVMLALIGGGSLLAAEGSSCIRRNVRVGALEVGGLTREEARAQLAPLLNQDPTLTLSAAGQTWPLRWSEVGQGYDLEATLDAAYQVGREAGGVQTVLAGLPWNAGSPVVVTPVIRPADPALVAAPLEAIAAQLALAPRDAQLDPPDAPPAAPGRWSAQPSQEGRELVRGAAQEAVLAALQSGASTLALPLRSLPPARQDAEPAYSHIATLTAEPFVLVIADPLTGELPRGYYAEFSRDAVGMAGWFAPRPTSTTVELDLNRQAVAAWLAEIAPQIDPAERLLDPAVTLERVMAALQARQHRAEARIIHPARTYTVQYGDALSIIAYQHNLPLYQIKLANPGILSNSLEVGQVITIPSVDVLFPHPLVPGKRIEIDLTHQQMTAFENEQPVFTFTVSSGISTTPTLAGQFQILFKEEDAFAKRWSLDMPYFMGIYEEDSGFFNGIHELPITAWGTRLSAGVLGWPASFGCIIVGEGDAATLFEWAPIGTLVRITGVAPGTPVWQSTLADLAPLTPNAP